MTVNPVNPVSVSLAPIPGTVCAGTPVTLTAIPINPGLSPSFQWVKNGVNVIGATNSTYTNTPVNNDAYKCILTSNISCPSGNPATSNTQTMTVNQYQTPAVSIAVSANPVCAGVNVTYTATATNGGSAPTYQWIVNSVNISGATNSTYSVVPTNNNVVKCQLTSSLMCTTANPVVSPGITMTVNPLEPVSVSVWTPSYAVMPGTTVTYHAVPTNGGTSPVYQWKVNNVVVGTNSSTYSYIPLNNNNIVCKVTTSLSGCITNNPATSNTVNMIVYGTGTPCTGVPTVIHGGKTYNTVQVGSQCWLRENMNIGTRINAGVSQTNNNIIEKYCYNNDTNKCNVYGGLYQWAEVVQYLNGVTNTTHWNPLPTGNVQGICPTGWHVPTYSEASTLMASLGGILLAGGPMKEVGLVHWGPLSNIGASNSSGFTALPSGSQLNGNFSNLRYYFNMWTITSGAYPDAAYYIGAEYGSTENLIGQSVKITGDAVRCLKN
jgi:uncharacterized protein (TIGR02145 family)